MAPSTKSINSQTRITLGLVVLFGGAAVRAAFVIGGWMEKMETGQQDIRDLVSTLDPWPVQDAAVYHATLGLLNPELTIPPVPVQGQ